MSEPIRPFPPRADDGVAVAGTRSTWAPPSAPATPMPPLRLSADSRIDSEQFQQIKGRVHRRLLDRLNLSSLEKVDRSQVVETIRRVVHDLLSQ
jgi:hypothetical protein